MGYGADSNAKRLRTAINRSFDGWRGASKHTLEVTRQADSNFGYTERMYGLSIIIILQLSCHTACSRVRYVIVKFTETISQVLVVLPDALCEVTCASPVCGCP